MKSIRFAAAIAAVLLCAVWWPIAAHADTTGVDVTGIVTDTLMLIITSVVGTGLLIVRSYLSKKLGLQLSDSDTAALNTALISGAHDYIANEVLKGTPITIDLKMQAANAALQYAKDHEGQALDRLRAAGLDPVTLSEKAQARAAAVLNLMPAPPATAVPAAAG